MSEAKKCDRCGKFYEATNEENTQLIWLRKQFDLCPECTEKFHDWFNNSEEENMKKIFLVKRIGKVDYDEYDSCVIIADDENEVNYMIDNSAEWYKETGKYINYNDEGITDRKITEINLETSESKELVSSFNAG